MAFNLVLTQITSITIVTIFSFFQSGIAHAGSAISFESSKPNRNSTNRTPPIAQGIPPGAIYLGSIGDNPVYQDPATGLVFLVFTGLVYIFSSIVEAVRYVGDIFFAKSKDNEKPTAKECSTALKFLKNYARLYRDLTGKNLSDNELKRLNEKRDNKTITNYDLPGRIQRNMPARFVGKTLAQVEAECSAR
jgi:hypothetical protein